MFGAINDLVERATGKACSFKMSDFGKYFPEHGVPGCQIFEPLEDKSDWIYQKKECKKHTDRLIWLINHISFPFNKRAQKKPEKFRLLNFTDFWYNQEQLQGFQNFAWDHLSFRKNLDNVHSAFERLKLRHFNIVNALLAHYILFAVNQPTCNIHNLNSNSLRIAWVVNDVNLIRERTWVNFYSVFAVHAASVEARKDKICWKLNDSVSVSN